MLAPKPLLTGIVACLAFCLASKSPTTERIPLDQFSSYNHTTLAKEMTVGQSIGSYDRIVRRALALMAQFGTIEIGNTDTYGAYSVVNRNNFRRYIIYSPSFFDDASLNHTDSLAVLSICFHEIAHLASIHQLQRGYSTKMFEREADRISGYYMCLARATLEQAQAALNRVGDENETDTHPGRAERLAEVKFGYAYAQALIFGDSTMLAPDTNNMPSVIAKTFTPPSPMVFAAPVSHRKEAKTLSLKNKVKFPQMPAFELLGEQLAVNEKGRLLVANSQREIGYYSPASPGNQPSLVIETSRYIIRNNLIFSGAPHAPALPLGFVIN